MDSLDALISRVCPFVAAGIVVGSIYWTAVTYGAITCMQILGHKEGTNVKSCPILILTLMFAYLFFRFDGDGESRSSVTAVWPSLHSW